MEWNIRVNNSRSNGHRRKGLGDAGSLWLRGPTAAIREAQDRVLQQSLGVGTTVDDARLISPNGHAALGLVFAGNDPPTSVQVATWLRATAPAGVTVAATSINDLQNAPGSGGLGILGEVVIGAIGALIVLVLVFGSFLALIPLIVAGVSILATFLLLGAITTITGVSQLVEYLVALIGLGVAIDYSLLIVTRWREERDRGRSNDEAVIVAMTTAGRSVLFSGVTVALGLFALIAVPFAFVRSLGYGGLLIPLVTVVAALTLLPVLLSVWGPRLDRRRRHHTPHPARRGTRTEPRLDGVDQRSHPSPHPRRRRCPDRAGDPPRGGLRPPGR